jgi:MYXO-CTERM domain-containing protein
LACVAVAAPRTALASVDKFGLGDGHSGAFVANAADQVINAYAPLTTDVAIGATSLPVGPRTGTGDFAAGDLVLVWQVGGIVAASGAQTPVDLGGSAVGHYELSRVQSFAAGTITLTEALISAFPAGSTQVIRVPEFSTVNIPAGTSLTAPAWNGSTGGVVAFLALGATTNEGGISVAGKGFRPGVAAFDPTTGCLNLDGNIPQYAQKGEGLGGQSTTIGGRGNIGNAGGGGNCHNAGGGGGGNAGAGGKGGGAWDQNTDFGGLGGAPVTNVKSRLQLVFGGGGGAGHVNESVGTNGSGAAGGGVIFARALSVAGTGAFLAQGNAALIQPQQCDPGGGGGAGGTVYLRVAGALSCGSINLNGGDGASHDGNCGTYTTQAMGVGGGGGGGRSFVQAGTRACVATAAAGAVGRSSGNVSILATAGAAGVEEQGPAGLYLVPSITSPAAGSTSTDAKPTITISGEPNTQTFVLVDVVVVCSGTSDATGAFSCAPATGLGNGTRSITARQSGTNNVTEAGPASTPVSITINTPVADAGADASTDASANDASTSTDAGGDASTASDASAAVDANTSSDAGTAGDASPLPASDGGTIIANDGSTLEGGGCACSTQPGDTKGSLLTVAIGVGLALAGLRRRKK